MEEDRRRNPPRAPCPSPERAPKERQGPGRLKVGGTQLLPTNKRHLEDSCVHNSPDEPDSTLSQFTIPLCCRETCHFCLWIGMYLKWADSEGFLLVSCCSTLHVPPVSLAHLPSCSEQSLHIGLVRDLSATSGRWKVEARAQEEGRPTT